MNFCIKSKNVLTPDGMKDAVIIIENGIIKDIVNQTEYSGIAFEDYGELAILPALTDTHVHINEPGREDWEGFETATKAAAAGGITTLADMPLNSSPVTIDIDSLNLKINSAKDKLYVDCGFYGGVIPGNSDKLPELSNSGVLGFKAFMTDSGIDEFPSVNESDLRLALKKLSGHNIPLLVHAETDCGFTKGKNYSEYSYDSFLSSRTPEWETKAIDILIRLSREFDHHIHIVHLSSAESVNKIKDAKSEGLKITVETCPHYLFFSSEEIETGQTLFKCTPPVRDLFNRERLWDAVIEGVIDFIVSDHSPCDPELKCIEEGSFEKAWGGISSLQLGLPAVWTECRKRGITLNRTIELMSKNTAEFIGTGDYKGKIEKGHHADLVIFDPEEKFKVTEEMLFHKHKKTPYLNRELYGYVQTVFLKGNRIFENGKILSVPNGKIIYGNN
ncbi:MAG TPA: allantoinase AllB [Ignavibacteria bacterium]|nr:allantoinase AllB [Ignavibacteria bacterium]HMR39281.1 allantoinase AllB [Ignavibacteria bacterium]